MKCAWCLIREATQELEDLQVCDTCYPQVKQYSECEICGREINGAYYRRHFERGICESDECKKAKDVKSGRLCCDQAKYTFCVCTRSYKCPVHGETHIGTHD